MPIVTLRIEPELCGAFSVGTVVVIKLIRDHLELDLDAAAAYVNRCVFDGEEVQVRSPSAAAAERFLTAVAALPHTPRVVAALRQAPEGHK